MSVFRNASSRLKKRDKAHRPPPLKEMAERQESIASGSRPSLDPPASSFLAVPNTARSAFFTLPSGMSSRSSLFTRSSTSTQDDKHRSFFKFSNLSRGSFVLKREREERKWNPFGSTDDTTTSSTRISRDSKERGYLPHSKRRESSSASMSNLLAGLDVIDISPASLNSNVRPRSRTFSAKSASDKPDLSLHVFTDLPPLNLPLATGRSSLGASSSTEPHVAAPPRPGSDASRSRVSPVQLPPLNELSPTIIPMSPRLYEIPLSPDEPTIAVKLGLHSPAPTIISATSISTVQDSLLSSCDVSSSESDPDQGFVPGEDDCGPSDIADSSVGDDSVLEYYQQVADMSTDHTPPRFTLTPSAQTSPSETLKRSGPVYFKFPDPPALPGVPQSPSGDLGYSSPQNMPSELPSPDNNRTFCEPSTSQLKSTLDVPLTPVRQLTANAFRAGNTPPTRKLRIRKTGESVTTIGSLSPKAGGLNTSPIVPLDEPPATPTMSSFLLGLAWPRPPLRQIYVDARKPSASWHAVSRTTDERLIDDMGVANTDPCHVIMLSRAGTEAGPGIAEILGLPEVGGGRRRSGLAMHKQQPLSTAAVSALAEFAARTRPLDSP